MSPETILSRLVISFTAAWSTIFRMPDANLTCASSLLALEICFRVVRLASYCRRKLFKKTERSWFSARMMLSACSRIQALSRTSLQPLGH